LTLDFAEALLNPIENEAAEGTSALTPMVAKLVRKRRLLTADSEIEISKKDYSQHLKDTSNIIKKVPPPVAPAGSLHPHPCPQRVLGINRSNAFYPVTRRS